MPRSLVCLVLLTLSVACRTAAPVAPDTVQLARTPAAAEWEKQLDAARFGPASPAQQQVFARIQKELEAAIQKDPADAHLHYLLGRVYFYGERDAEAGQEFDKALALAPDVAEYHYLKGYSLGFTQDSQGSIAELTRATELAPRTVKYWSSLGAALAAKEDKDKARDAFEHAIALDPEDAESSGFLGLMRLEEGNEAEALRWLAKTTPQHPRQPMLQYNIAQAYQNHGDHERALAHFQSAARDMPEDWRTLAKLVQEHEALKQFKERDAARARLVKLNDEGKVDSPFFVREQFQEGAAKVMVAEHFKLEGDWAVRYVFYVETPGATDTPVRWRLSLGSYAFTNDARPEGAKERLFHFDGYEEDDSHLTFAFFDGEPSYEDTRKLAVAVLRGEVKPVSGTRFNRE
ncbi:tetratricopeptide repeat protein [Corallococcus exercitus]|uniref:tetratricopeptide repeat protein n=1 Tax=Corallococcus exercitus TaxID=2316736 RepID=UPI000EA033C3|nr:tetratricopeptide repeat protein [Corallococcus exercitus]RKG64459.1 tetratricopeptide repeat protein [Corallococcus exercitus]